MKTTTKTAKRAKIISCVASWFLQNCTTFQSHPTSTFRFAKCFPRLAQAQNYTRHSFIFYCMKLPPRTFRVGFICIITQPRLGFWLSHFWILQACTCQLTCLRQGLALFCFILFSLLLFTVKSQADLRNGFQPGTILPHQQHWQCLNTFFIVETGRVLLASSGWGQGCC